MNYRLLLKEVRDNYCGAGDFEGTGENMVRLIPKIDAALSGFDGWISVEDRLPLPGIEALGFIPYNPILKIKTSFDVRVVSLSYRYNNKPHWDGTHQVEPPGLAVTHWMYMPDPPKEKPAGEMDV